MMERLTKMHYKSSDGHYMACSELIECDGRCADCPYLDNMVERLAAYEDTHMMPSDVTSMRMDMAILTALFDGIDVDRMREIVAAERDGRAVVLPCKVGDTVWMFSENFGEVLPYTVDLISVVGKCLGYSANCSRNDELLDSIDFEGNDIGMDVFFTREEAEQTLRKEKVTE